MEGKISTVHTCFSNFFFFFKSESGIWIVRSAIPEFFMLEHFRPFYGSAREIHLLMIFGFCLYGFR